MTSIARGTENSRNWDLVLRYERSLYEELSTYLSQGVEADVFAGYTQRYNTDAGAKYTLIKQKELNWSVEGGYRLSIQNAINGTKRTDHFLRAYTEVNKMWTETFSVRYWVEALPNVTESEGFRINTELSGVATLSSIFSLKAGYGIRFNNLPPAGAPYKTDSVFTTALVAKFSPETK